MAPAVRRAASDNVPVATKIPASKPQDNATDDNYVMINGRKYSKATPLPREETTNYDIINGDHGLDPAADLQDSLWTLTPEPHGLRRQEMIKELGKEVHKLQGYEPLTKYIVVVLMAMQCGMGYYLREEALYGGTLKFWLISYFFGAIMAQALFLAAHEISHNLAFKTLNANRWFGMFTNLPLVLPFFIAFKEYHNLHHKYQGSELDEDLPSDFEIWLCSTTPGKWFWQFNQVWAYALRPVVMHPLPLNRWLVANAVIQIIFTSAVVYFIGWGPVFYFLLSDHFAGSIHPIAAHHIAEHYVFAGEHETGSYYGPLNWLTWNVGMHDPHHDFPNVPWSNLPALRRLGDKWYSKIPYHKSWVGVLYTFLMDPTVTLNNRVRRHEANKPKVE